jgi:hypothetical protein
MPGHLLHEHAVVECAHVPGHASPKQTDLRVTVSGQRIVTKPMLYRISGCSNPPPSSGSGPCLTATWTSAAERIKASGYPVLLADSEARCTPTNTPLKIVSTQTRVKGT